MFDCPVQRESPQYSHDPAQTEPSHPRWLSPSHSASIVAVWRHASDRKTARTEMPCRLKPEFEPKSPVMSSDVLGSHPGFEQAPP